MNRIQKATAAAMALTITLVGSTLVTAPLVLADSQQAVTRAHHWSSSHLRLASSHLHFMASSQRVSGTSTQG